MVGSCCILFPSVVLPSWALFCYPKFGGQSWKEPVIGHIFFLMDLINMGIYSSLKREAWKKIHKQRSYDTFSSVCTFAVPYFIFFDSLSNFVTELVWVRKLSKIFWIYSHGYLNVMPLGANSSLCLTYLKKNVFQR